MSEKSIQVTIYTSAKDAEPGLLQCPADIAIIDVGMWGHQGLELIAKLKEVDPHLRCLVLTVATDNDTVHSTLMAGANGYMLKTAPMERIADALLDIERGGLPLSPFISGAVVSYFHAQAVKRAARARLSKRQQEIMQQVAQGYLYKEIAHMLGIHHNTVKKHMMRIFRILGVQNRAEAVNMLFG